VIFDTRAAKDARPAPSLEGMRKTIKKLTSALGRNLTPPDGVHFHPGPGGAYVCGNPECTSPGLAREDVR
jgi:hypothetical protein